MLNKTYKKAFTLVELLVVITILAIISVVAYQSFSGATDKAVGARKISDVATIESSLQQYKIDKKYYPKVDEYNENTNMWGYNSNFPAQISNTILVSMNSAEIKKVENAKGGGIIKNSDDQQIGAKGVISQNTLGKQYLSTDLYDPEIGKEKESDTNQELIKKGIGRYVYAVYRKPTGEDWGTSNKSGTYFNIAYTVKKEDSDTYITKIVGDYDEKSCFENKDKCPETLIGSGTGSTRGFLINEQEMGKNINGTNLSNFGSNQPNQGIPYAVGDFETNTPE